uniref:Uncharacterized protein ORF-c10_009 n=1 Tax=Saccharolobus solfataricus TaxID=2287 RepID=Q9UXB0_SACSO|nr:hypothetical protein [Saccharolobus solfataricus P2]
MNCILLIMSLINPSSSSLSEISLLITTIPLLNLDEMNPSTVSSEIITYEALSIISKLSILATCCFLLSISIAIISLLFSIYSTIFGDILLYSFPMIDLFGSTLYLLKLLNPSILLISISLAFSIDIKTSFILPTLANVSSFSMKI